MPKLRKAEQEIIESLEPYLVNLKTNVNTNNAWGFGGALKDIYEYNYEGTPFSIHVGIASTRHAGTSRIFNLWYKDDIVSRSIKYVSKFVNALQNSNTSEKAIEWLVSKGAYPLN